MDRTTAKLLSCKTEDVTGLRHVDDLTDERQMLMEPVFLSPDATVGDESETVVSLPAAGPPSAALPLSTSEELARGSQSLTVKQLRE